MATLTLRIVRAVFLLAFSMVATPTLTAQTCPALVWSDEFDGTALDPTKWTHQLGDGCSIGLCGWGNRELQTYQAANATVADGLLRITARQETVRGRQRYTSSRIRTLDKGDWRFGRFEARIKLTQGQGIWPAFWMMPTDEVRGWPTDGEIDIMENVGHEPRTVHGTMHFGDAWPDNRSSGASFTLHPDQGLFADDFHTFAVEREPGEIRWFVDDVLYSTQTAADTEGYTWPFDERFHFILNLAVGGNWPGSPDETTVFPQILEVDYVRVYNAAFPHLIGTRAVANRASGIAYAVRNAPDGSAFAWTVPAGATITGGQGTASIRVDWSDAGGEVEVAVRSACGAQTLALNVEVEPVFTR